MFEKSRLNFITFLIKSFPPVPPMTFTSV